MTYRIATLACLLLTAMPATSETIVGRLLTAELAIYENAGRKVLTAVVRAKNGNYQVLKCDLPDSDPQPAVDLTEAHALMTAYVRGGSGMSIEATVTPATSVSGFPTYTLNTWEMPIPGFDDYRFTCGPRS